MAELSTNYFLRSIKKNRSEKFPESSSYCLHDDHFLLLDYNQYTVNQTVPIQPPPQQPQQQPQQQQQQQNIRAEVSPSSKPYVQKPKKVAVHEADKYNINQDVTIQDYDIYDSQVC